MITGDAALYWLKDYFDQRPNTIITLNIYGPNVPSNNIEIRGDGWFRFAWCPSWPAPQVNCSLNLSNLAILNDILAVIEVREDTPL